MYLITTVQPNRLHTQSKIRMFAYFEKFYLVRAICAHFTHYAQNACILNIRFFFPAEIRMNGFHIRNLFVYAGAGLTHSG